MSGNPYNGFSWSERMAKYKEMQRRIASGVLASPTAPCQLCSQPASLDPAISFEYHDEDYSQEYSWTAPAVYILCRGCHIYRIHQRFTHPVSWAGFLAHVRRGGFASEMKEPAVSKELSAYNNALRVGASLPVLKSLRPYKQIAGMEWFANLSSDPAAKPFQQVANAP